MSRGRKDEYPNPTHLNFKCWVTLDMAIPIGLISLAINDEHLLFLGIMVEL
jgi:hypothetical protein